MSSDGYTKLEDLLALPSFKSLAVTAQEVLDCARSNKKQRFQLKGIGADTYIRAVQGHTLDGIVSEDGLETLTAFSALRS